VFCSLEKGSKQFINSSINKRKLIQQLSLLRRKEHREIFIESRCSKFPMIVTGSHVFTKKKSWKVKLLLTPKNLVGALYTHKLGGTILIYVGHVK
jgi:hypothetical protein